jgi:non-heme chloroperoxidase
MPTVTTQDGTRIAYRSIGNGAKTVILVHGWMVSGAGFGALTEALDTAGLRVLVPDLRGSGESDRPASGHTYKDHAADVLAVADAEGAKSFVVVGHSMGGLIAAWLAATSPERVSGAVLLCSVPPSGFTLPPDYAALFHSCTGDREKQRTILGAGVKDMSEKDREAMLDDGVRTSEAAIQQGFESWTTASFVDRMSGVKAPFVVVASDDPFMPPDFLRKSIVNHVPHSRLVYIPGAGHYVHAERPRETAAVIGAFMAGLGV